MAASSSRPRTRDRAAQAAAKPVGALLSQGIVAGSSLVLQIIALRELGAAGLGSFSLLFGVLITVNSIQSGWIGDSLTVLDRFEPGIRRALVQSQVAVIGLVFVSTAGLALVMPVGDVDLTLALLFGLASVMWVVEETLRRLLIARREFWKLVANDASFALGAFGLIAFVVATGNTFTLETLVLALFAGAVVAIAVGVAQLPRAELSRGLLGPSRLRELSSFAVWRAAQIGLRPGSQQIVRVIIVVAASREVLGQLETARLLLAPVLTAVNGAGVYLLPTYSSQARRRRPFRPAVPRAMAVVGAMAAAYGALTLWLRDPLVNVLTDGTTEVAAAALLSWSLFAVGFGAGVPAGNAMVALGRSRTAFSVRVLDAAAGVVAAGLIAVGGWSNFVPAGLALGTFVGAGRLLHLLWRDSTPNPLAVITTEEIAEPVVPEAERIDEPTWMWQTTSATPTTRSNRSAPRAPRSIIDTPTPAPVASARSRAEQRLLWIVPLVMIVATEYKVRRRSIDEALAGAVDPMIAVELGIYGLIGAWAIWRLAPAPPRMTALTMVMWGYILTTATSGLYSTFPLLAMARSVQLVIIGAVIHLLAVDGTIGTVRRFLHGWIVLMSLSILIGLAYVAPTTTAQVGRFTWLSVHSVSAGSMLALSICVLFGLWLAAGRPVAAERLPWPRAVYGSLLVVQVIFLLLTRTRGSIGATFVAIGVMALVWSGTRMKPQLVLGCIVAGGALMLAFGESILRYLTRGESAASIGTFNRRTEIWTLAWESFLGRPLHGLGFTSAKGVFFDETGLGGAHNAVINVMIDSGLIGLFWWTALIVAAVMALSRQRRMRSWIYGGPLETDGATGSIRSDHLTLGGVILASLLNSITTEGLGAGVNVSAIWLFFAVAWLTILDREARAPREPFDAGVGDEAPVSVGSQPAL